MVASPPNLSAALAAKSSARALDPMDLFDLRGQHSDDQRMVQDSVARLVVIRGHQH